MMDFILEMVVLATMVLYALPSGFRFRRRRSDLHVDQTALELRAAYEAGLAEEWFPTFRHKNLDRFWTRGRLMAAEMKFKHALMDLELK